MPELARHLMLQKQWNLELMRFGKHCDCSGRKSKLMAEVLRSGNCRTKSIRSTISTKVNRAVASSPLTAFLWRSIPQPSKGEELKPNKMTPSKSLLKQ
jgi:hypothetical protein